MTRYKIGAVSYLNTKPLTRAMELNGGMTSPVSRAIDLADLKYDLVYDLPSALADRLAAGELDVALVPSIALASPNPKTQQPYAIVSDACIGCRGPVWSVKLLSRKPPAEIQTLALDDGSRTSQCLVQILLNQQFNVRPEISKLEIKSDWRACTTDAVMIIGDRAMNAAHTDFPVEIDLGQSWFDMTGLPFVFAVWAARPDIDPHDLDRLGWLMTASRDMGLASVVEIAQDNHQAYGLSQAECLRYLDHYLHFELLADEKAAIQRYYQHASDLNLISNPAPTRFHDCQTTG